MIRKIDVQKHGVRSRNEPAAPIALRFYIVVVIKIIYGHYLGGKIIAAQKYPACNEGDFEWFYKLQSSECDRLCSADNFFGT